MLRSGNLSGFAARSLPVGTGTGKAVVRWKAWGSSDFGFSNGASFLALQYSADGSTWYTADTVNVDTAPVDRTIFPVGAWPYWQVLNYGGGDTRFAEVQFWDASGQIAQGTGTQIGNATQQGGLAAAWDGNTSQVQTACAYKTGGNGAVGKHY